MKQISLFLLIFPLLFSFCTKHDELSLEELEAMNAQGLAELLEKTVSKPYMGETFQPGRLGGIWHEAVNDDPKSFNHLIAEQDSSTAAVVSAMTDVLIDYDTYKRSWKARIAEPQIIVNEQNNTMKVIYTLRDDIYWSYYNSNRKEKVTSDDVIFWYNEIEGDPDLQSSGYYGQFLTMSDGSDAHIDIEKIDDLRFSFNFPRIIAEPYLMTNRDFGPRHVYEPAKKQGGVEAVKNLYNVSVNPKEIPSMGKWFLTEYTPGQRLVYKRNPDYWEKDSNGVSLPYIEEMICRIIPEENTQLLIFKNGETEFYRLRPEDLDSLINNKGADYTIFNSEGALSASFWTFNQNPIMKDRKKDKDKRKYDWFTQKEFRQAMSCLLNRDRINAQVYRGLAEPKLNIFPEPNPFYNPDLVNEYMYNTERALSLLSSIGFERDKRGRMRDSQNHRIEFNLMIRSESSVNQDIASIIRDELEKIGIKVNIRVLDFQKQVQSLISVFDWDSMLIGLSGSNIFPSQGSNVWPSSGNLHMWNPNQITPATDWEARIDYLYNEGKFTLDQRNAQAIWDEFQSIMIEQLPLIHLMRSRGFGALSNRWDFTNVYFDNLRGAETNYIFLK